MNRLLDGFLRRTIRTGALQIVYADGSRVRYGDGAGESVCARFTTAAAEWRILLRPELELGEAWMDGTFVMEAGTLYDFIDLAFRNTRSSPGAWWMRLDRAGQFVSRHLRQMNSPRRARRNAHRHYDLDARLFACFLDADLQYSCAYWDEVGIGLDQAQLAKKRHLTAKLALQPGQRVLDIGCGWGGLALYLAEHADVEVTGITLAEEQLAVATARAAERGLTGRVRFRLADYRDVEGPFDRIVSVGMFEHVGVAHFDRFFRTCRDLLTADGIALVHSVGRFEGPRTITPWVQRHIFPGGHIPALSEAVPAVERSGLLLADIEILRLHYAETLRSWRERFLTRRAEVEAMYDERFCRMWEFYLVTGEASFRHAELMVFQLQLAKRLETLPLTRDYMIDVEGRLRDEERRATHRGRLKVASD